MIRHAKPDTTKALKLRPERPQSGNNVGQEEGFDEGDFLCLAEKRKVTFICRAFSQPDAGPNRHWPAVYGLVLRYISVRLSLSANMFTTFGFSVGSYEGIR